MELFLFFTFLLQRFRFSPPPGVCEDELDLTPYVGLTLNPSPPPAVRSLFIPCPGDPTMPFNTWLRIFENYLLVINATGTDWPDARKRAVLLHCLGTEGQRLFYTLPNTGDSFTAAVTALTAHFIPKVKIIVERHAFRKRAQGPQETVLQYVAALRDLAATCEFTDRESEMIRDQLIENVNSPRIRERLLLEPTLTLDKAITLATQIESASEHAKSIAQDRHIPVQAVQIAPSHGRPRFKHKSRTPNAQPAQNPVRSARTCYRCGSGDHMANARDCPAAKATCKNCQKTGHFARVCRSEQRRPVREVDVPEITVLCIDETAPAKGKISCRVQIQPAASRAFCTDLLVDTGSSVSLLPRRIYEEHLRESKLTKPSVHLVTYAKTPIPVLGCLPVTVSKDDVTVSATFFIVETGTPLMGMDLVTGLRLRIEGATVLPSAPASAAPVLHLSSATASSPPPAIGCAKNFIHRVKVSRTVTPVRQKLRRLPLSVRDAVTDELNRLLAAGVIENIDASEWISPIVVTQKKTGGIRMCVDLREPNKAVIMDSYPLPHMDELLSSLRGATVFSTIDLASAYHQVPLHEDSRDLTAFITHEGLFRFLRVPYGLSSAPSAFQKMMATILQGLPGVKNYLDDVIIYGATADEHDRRLKAVLRSLKDAGLQLNEDKCHFNQTSLRFLGHSVSAQGILPDKDHIEAVLNAPAPADAAALRSFLGLVSWYSKFLPNYATVVEPMRACIRQDTDYIWTDEAQTSFTKVKELLVGSPALALFDPALPTVISTDASDYGLGAVFTQIHPNHTERTVAFASRTLTPAERKYSTVEKEALGCVWAVEKWRTYLWGRRFTLRTDHQALTTLLTTKGLGRAGMRIARWSARLLCFDYDVIYRPGAQNFTADCLSRLPLPACSEPPVDVEPEFVAMLSTALSALPVREAVLSRQSPYALCWSPWLTKAIRGVVRTKQRLRDLYWWPHLDALVLSTIASCQPCQLNDKTATPHAAPLQPVPLPDGPWRKLGMDILGPFEIAKWDCKYAITLTDYYSKWPEVAFTPSVTTADITAFLTTVFARHGLPECITTDHGPQFTSAAFTEFLKERNIKQTRSSVYHPAANGAVERFNRVLKESIQTAMQHSLPWKAAVTECLQVFRATPHATTGVSPFEMLHGRKMRTKLDILSLPGTYATTDAQVRQRVHRQQSKMKIYTDAKRGARIPQFREGDKVRIKNPLHVLKGHSKFSAPVDVRRQVGPSTYVLGDGKTWNASHLTLFPIPAESETPAAAAPSSSVELAPDSRVRRRPLWLKDYDP
ncbi:hypothetical protein SKAU_G00116460 [Synaphobranchus kaupii]|uniref:Gypsy retrotransposon integrase-like protein 1 n=1 Tax=Synaphobranchus kaupii TaxID=118154 RepID=A0A9Q1FMQ6_SYNKA|nr:hypothetical protein SKAU_G00116460 [Synaphobranchus kaupii]